jgi:hypothetical protein
MINTSTNYLNAINANAVTNFFKGTFGFVPPGAVEGATAESLNEAAISRTEQINDGVSEMTKKWATLERNRWVLDDTMSLPPLSADTNNQFGYWSAVLCDENGKFPADNLPYVIYQFDKPYDIVGITLTFDTLCGEYPTELTINSYGSDGSLLNSLNVANSKTILVQDIKQLNVNKLEILFNAWCLPFHRAKMVELLPGEIYTFDNSNIISFSLDESINPFSGTFTAPEFEIKYDNSEREFDVLNPEGVFQFLEQKMEMQTQIGTLLQDGSIEWVPTGSYYLYEIPTDQQQETATFVCRPSISFCENINYPTNETMFTTVQHVVETIFTTGNITEAYTIDESLQDLQVNAYCGEDISLVEAFGLIAVAAGAYWKVNRDGSYSLLPIPSEFINPTADLDYDTAKTKPTITLNRVTSVKVTGNTQTISDNKVEQLNGFDVVITAPVDDGNSVTISSAFIGTAERAQGVGQLALAYYNNKLTYQTSYRGNPANEVGDIISLETDYSTLTGIITDSNITYDNQNFLSSDLKGRG